MGSKGHVSIRSEIDWMLDICLSRSCSMSLSHFIIIYYLLFHWCFSTLAKIPTDIDMQYKMFSYLNITSWYICSHLGLWEPNHVGFFSRSPWNPGSAHLSAPPHCKPGPGPALPPGRVLREEHCIPHEGTVPCVQRWASYLKKWVMSYSY